MTDPLATATQDLRDILGMVAVVPYDCSRNAGQFPIVHRISVFPIGSSAKASSPSSASGVSACAPGAVASRRHVDGEVGAAALHLAPHLQGTEAGGVGAARGGHLGCGRRAGPGSGTGSGREARTARPSGGCRCACGRPVCCRRGGTRRALVLGASLLDRVAGGLATSPSPVQSTKQRAQRFRPRGSGHDRLGQSAVGSITSTKRICSSNLTPRSSSTSCRIS